MLIIEEIDVQSTRQVNEFIRFPFDLYKKNPYWVPPFYTDMKIVMNKEKHPFYEHSDASFFIAKRDGKVVGRIAALENRPFNRYHNVKDGEFYYFDCEDDQEAATALFNRVFEWAHQRGLNHIVGPKGFCAFDGYGIQVEGFDHRCMMTMMNYNYPYYQKLVEAIGFTKEVDFVSCYIKRDEYVIAEKVQKAAAIARKRGSFLIHQFKNKAELKKFGKPILEAYNNTFINNWEYYPLTEREVQFLLNNLLMIADPKYIKIIQHEDKIVGFLLAFPDISAALQRSHGKINPFSIADMLLEIKRTKWITFNGVGILPEYQGLGGNAILYDEMQRTMKESPFIHSELTNMAETAIQIRKDIITLGSTPYKNHRVFQIHI
jgi:hypothetical protein